MKKRITLLGTLIAVVILSTFLSLPAAAKVAATDSVCWPLVKITDLARDKIKEALDQNAGKYLRLFIQGIG